MEKKTLLYLFTSVFILLIIYAIFRNIFYFPDLITSIIIIFLLYKYFNKLELNNFIFFLLFLALLFHDFGVFGFYNKSPLYFQYDNLTHFIGGIALGIFFINFFKKNIDGKLLIIFLALLSALGVGAVVEIIEYSGYLYLGQGDGFFYFGGKGDLGRRNSITGAWANSSIDMVLNLVGGIIGIISYLIYKKFK